MLFILIPAVWIALVAFFAILCRGVARADAELASTATNTRILRHGALTLFEDRHSGHDLRVRGLRAVRVRDGRPRGERSVAGS